MVNMAYPSSSRKRDRLKFWKRWRKGRSGDDLTDGIAQAQNEECVVAEHPSLSTGSSRPQPLALFQTIVAPVETTILPEPHIESDTIPETDEAMTGPPSLWDLAYEALRKEKPEVVEAYEELLSKVLLHMTNTSSTTDLGNVLSEASSGSAATTALATEKSIGIAHNLTSRRKMMTDAIALGQTHMDGKRIAFKIGPEKFMLRDQMEHVINGIQVGKDWIGEAVKASPLASVAWAGVCLLLPLLTNPSEVQKVNEEGLAYTAQKIRYYTAMEPLLLTEQDEKTFTAAMKREYEQLFIQLYQAIIDFQAQSVLRFFRRRFGGLLRDAIKWDPWEDTLKEVKKSGDNLEKTSLQINSSLNTTALGKIIQGGKDRYEDECLQSLSGDYAWYKDRIDDRVRDTCRWFLNHSSYQSWLEDDFGPLLVSADPGCGKSVLAKYLIDSRFGFRVPKEATICYFFFKDGDKNTIVQALCALVHQLLCLRPQLRHHATERYKQDGKTLSSNVTALWDILENAAADPKAKTIVIVLDALDECSQDERNMATLSRYIRTHFERGPKKLKILMTSRPYQNTIRHIQELEQAFPNIRVKGEDKSETIREEINSVIEFRVQRMHQFDDGLKTYLKQCLLNIAHRTYLWLYLVFAYLDREVIKNTTKRLDEVIQTLPTTVEDAYEKILRRSHCPEETRNVMLILLAATRPLSLAEMQIALNVTVETRSWEDLDLEPIAKFKDRLREMCGLFVTVHEGRVYFLHQTVREFLLPLSASSQRTTTSAMFWAHSLNERQAQTCLAESCVAYLALFDSPRRRDIPDNTEGELIEYAAENWVTHFRNADISHDAAVVPLAARICDIDSKCHNAWYSSARKSDVNELGILCDSLSLGVASCFGLEAVTRLLLESDDIDIEAKNRDGSTPLWFAAHGGHKSIFHQLIAVGKIDINSPGMNGKTPLMAAIGQNHRSIVEILLDTGKADVNLSDRDGDTPLILAITNRDDKIVKLLLDTDKIDVNLSDRDGDTPLIKAICQGEDNIVKLLIGTRKVDINLSDRYGDTPLIKAIFERKYSIVQLLLGTRKVDINLSNRKGNTALILATMGNNYNVVKLLLHIRKVDVNLSNKKGNTALILAAINKNSDIVKLLLCTGKVDVNLSNKHGNTALIEAMHKIGDDVIELLLNTGKVNVNLSNRYGNIPLIEAIHRVEGNAVGLLLDTGKVDVNLSDKNGDTPLIRAIYMGKYDIVKLLLDTGKVDINLRDKHGKTALMRATDRGHETIVKMLTEYDAGAE